MSEMELAHVIRQLRQELQSAMEAAKDEGLRFKVQDLEVEMQVAVTQGGAGEVSGGGGVKFWVLDAKAESKAAAKYEASRLQKIKLRLTPVAGDDSEDDVMLAG